MAQITREAIYAFEAAAAVQDRMPAFRPTGYMSNLLGPTTNGAVYWYTNDRGDLVLNRLNAINLLQGLQRWTGPGTTVDRYYGSQTRTRLLQQTGLADGPRGLVEMRELLERAVVMARHGGVGAVIFPQRTRFPTVSTLSLVDGAIAPIGSSADLLYWDGSRGAFPGRGTPAPTPLDNPLPPVEPSPERQRIMMS